MKNSVTYYTTEQGQISSIYAESLYEEKKMFVPKAGKPGPPANKRVLFLAAEDTEQKG